MPRFYPNPLVMKFKNKEPEKDLLKRPYSDEELQTTEDMKKHIEKLMKFFDEQGISYDKFDPKSIPKLDLDKRKAYPNNDVYQYIPGQHDTQKWLQAIGEIYRKEKSGENRVTAIRRVTSGWNIMETHDFLNWIKFHESGDHMKYKFAKLWYESPDVPNYAFPMKEQVTNTQDSASAYDYNFARDKAEADSERKQTIEKQRNKIIGRLDSAEKLLRSPDGHVFSGKEFENLLEAIYQLKKKIQMVNKITASTRLYEDMIVREANILHKRGFVYAADMLYSVADEPALTPAAPTEPTGAGAPGAPGGTPATGPGMPQGAPSSAAPAGVANENTPTSIGLVKFLKGLEKVNFSPSDNSKVEDDLEVEDENNLEVMDSDDELFVTEAQIPPGARPPAPEEPESLTTTPAPAPLDPSPVSAPDAPKAELKGPGGPDDEPLEVTEDDIKKPVDEPSPGTSDFDAKVDSVFAGITVADVVSKLEDLAKIFKTREVPRQLGIVDMMLDSLGLASYFPSLSEATNKALESNNYISTRVEDIISKLRGAMDTKDIDLKGKGNVENPAVAGIKGKLTEDSDKEKARKQMRKDQESAELAGAGKETPEVEVEEDLGAPPAPPPAAAPPRAARPPI